MEPCSYVEEELPSTGKSRCKGPEAGTGLVGSQIFKEVVVAGAELMKGRVGADGAGPCGFRGGL